MNQAHKTFAIISHPDAGKTTLTEQILAISGAIKTAGSIKAKKTARHATSDWMEMEKQRGISITTSVMQFIYQSTVFNLLDTPGHADFSEDTYRTLTAVDSAIMVIDAAKGVEPRTKKLFEICCQRKIPVITFINKIDRNAQEPLTLLDDIEKQLGIKAIPVNWPIGSGQTLKGIIHKEHGPTIVSNHNLADYDDIEMEFELAHTQTEALDEEYQLGQSTPVFFGSALRQLGMEDLLQYMVTNAPAPTSAPTEHRDIQASETKFTGFVFKIQANMNPKHRDRLAFLRICSGTFRQGMQVLQVRTGKKIALNKALLFLADSRSLISSADAGDIIGIYNHGGIQIGDSFTEGEVASFIGIPSFAPELFKRIQIKNPLKAKHLQKGLKQLSEEGAIQIFKPTLSNTIIIGAIGMLQFDVVAHRLHHEYQVDCIYEASPIQSVRWIDSESQSSIDQFMTQYASYVAFDSFDRLVYLMPNHAHLRLVKEKYPDLYFHQTRE